MPNRPKQYRPHPTPKRAPAPAEATRGSRHERGYTARWSRFARLYLKAHPTCVLCAERGRAEAATCVDHLDGLGPNGERGYDETNLRALCTSCHNRRSATDRHAAAKSGGAR